MLNFYEFKNSVNEKLINKTKVNKSNKDLSRLFQPNGIFKNCFYFENLTDNNFFNISGVKDEFVEFYKKAIKSGVGCIILGGVYLGLNNNPYNNISRITLNEDVISAYKKITTYAHSYNCKIFLQIKSMYGRFNHLYNTKNKIKIASNYNFDPLNKQRLVLRVSDNKCNELFNEFIQIKILSEISNFDGYLIDASYSNLIGELLSKEFNKRIFGYFTDPCEILNKLLHDTNNNKITLLKINIVTLFNEYKSANNIQNNKNNAIISNIIADLIKFIEIGVDGFEFIFGREENKFLSEFNEIEDELIYLNFYKEFKKELKHNNIKNKSNEEIILLCHDNFIDFKNSVSLVKNNIIDLINITRDFYADINFIKSLKNNKSYQKCIKCSDCNFKAQFNNKVECLINPSLLNNSSIIKIKNKRSVAVVGSGLSGLYCSLILLQRGFKVFLFEKESKINPIGKLEMIFNSNTLLNEYFSYIEKMLKPYENNNLLQIYLNHTFTENEDLSKYDYIVLATGFKRKLLAVAGAILPHVYDIYEILKNESKLINKKNVVIYARTILSLKLAFYLANNNYKNITIVINDVDLFLKYKNANLYYYFYILEKLNVSVLFFSKVTCINEDNINIVCSKTINHNVWSDFLKIISKAELKNERKQLNLDCDMFIYEPETIPNNPLYYPIVSSGYSGEVFVIGNALENSPLDDVVKSAYFVAKNM